MLLIKNLLIALMHRNDDPLAAVHFATLGTLFRHTDSFCSELKHGWDCVTDLAQD
jgi:hypothetical protein